jgi:hypothetical protein
LSRRWPTIAVAGSDEIEYDYYYEKFCAEVREETGLGKGEEEVAIAAAGDEPELITVRD